MTVETAGTAKAPLIIFDTSLRDGEQSPGVTLSAQEKVDIARQLARLGVDVCEAGFPIASQGDFDAVRRIATEVGPVTAHRRSGKPMVIAGLARAVPADILRAYEAVKAAPLHRIHTFLATSDVHLTHKLKISRDECVARAVAAVKYACSLGCTDVEFSPEDAGRSDRQFLCKVLGAVIEAGATTLNIPDTVGYNTPTEYGSMMAHLIANTPGADKVVWSTHCHNDLGLATANTLSGVINGARQVEVTINGIGERAGNTALEEIVMAIYTHPETYPVHINNVDTQQIYVTSGLVSKSTGMVVQPNKAIVGANAFSHESGIHQDGVLKHKETYEIIKPESIGLPSQALVLGKHSGRAAFRSRIAELLSGTIYGDQLLREDDTSAFESLFTAFKRLADTKKSGVTQQDLYALLDDILSNRVAGSSDPASRERYVVKSVQVVSGTGVLATATISLLDRTLLPPSTPTAAAEDSNGDLDQRQGLLVDAAIGHGPVHAIFSAINRLTGFRNNVLTSYEVKAVTEGSDSLGRVVVRIQDASNDAAAAGTPGGIPRHESDLESTVSAKGEVYLGHGTDEDILVASAKAYVNAVNRIVNARILREKMGVKDAAGRVEVVGGEGTVDAVPKSRKVDV